MDAVVRRVSVCGSCGGHITQYDQKCGYCGHELELVINSRHILPHVTRNQFAAEDANTIKPQLEKFENFQSFRPMEVDDLIDALVPLRDHHYPYREYIIDLLSNVHHFRGCCMVRGEEARKFYLDVYKMIDAIYNSLTGISVY